MNLHEELREKKNGGIEGLLPGDIPKLIIRGSFFLFIITTWSGLQSAYAII